MFNITGNARWDQMFSSLIINNWSISNQKLLTACWNQYIATKISQIRRTELRATLLFTYSSNLGKNQLPVQVFSHEGSIMLVALCCSCFIHCKQGEAVKNWNVKIWWNDWFFFMFSNLLGWEEKVNPKFSTEMLKI